MTSISAKVAAIITESQVAFNIGSDVGVKIGDTATYYESMTIKDPDSHETLGTIGVERLRFRIDHVQEKLSTGAVTTLQHNVRTGVASSRRMQIAASKIEEETGVSIKLAVGDRVTIEISEKKGGAEFTDEPPF